MKRNIVLLVIFSLLGFFRLNAENIYVSQNGSGVQDGSSPANSFSVLWLNTGTSWGNGLGKIDAGDTVRLTGTITEKIGIGGSGSPGNPIVILFEKNSKISMAYWDGFAIGANSKSHVVVDGGENGTIEATDNGTTRTNRHGNCGGVKFLNVAYGQIKNLHIKDLYVRTPFSSDSIGGATGIYIDGNASSNLQIHHNTISEVESGVAWTIRQGLKNVSIFSNTISRMSNGIFIGNSGANCTADSVDIHHNDISEGFVWEGGGFHNDGIQVFSLSSGCFITHLRIHENYIHGDMGLNTTGFCFLSGGDGTHIIGALMYNNIFSADSSRSPANGFFTIKDVAGAKIFNNTVISKGGSSIGVHLNSGANSTTIKNNIFHKISCGIYCTTKVSGSQVDTSDFNIFYGLINTTLAMSSNTGFKTWPQWLALGYDANSLTNDPQLVNNYQLQSTSPAIDNGTSAISGFSDDIQDTPRPQGASWDIGAFEYIDCSAYKPSLGNDTTICKGQTLQLAPGILNASYLWSTGETTQQISISSASSIWVLVTNNLGCSETDTLHISTDSTLLSLGSDTVLCLGQTISLNPGNGFTSFSWSTGASTQQISITNSSTISLTVVGANGCAGKDTITITFNACTGISSIEQPPLAFFPNPTKNEITLNGLQSLLESQVTFSVYNLYGELVYEQVLDYVKANSFTIYLKQTHLTSGAYLFTLKGANVFVKNKFVYTE